MYKRNSHWRDAALYMMLGAASSALLWARKCLKIPSRFGYTHADLCALPLGSLGRVVADALNTQGHTLLHGYENHDFEHVIFGYSMDVVGEVRLQAYLCGAGYMGKYGAALLLVGIAVMPDYWRILYHDYHLGRKIKNKNNNLIIKDLVTKPFHEAQAIAGLLLVLF